MWSESPELKSLGMKIQSLRLVYVAHETLPKNKKGRRGGGKRGALTQFCVSSLKGDTTHSFCKATAIFKKSGKNKGNSEF